MRQRHKAVQICLNLNAGSTAHERGGFLLLCLHASVPSFSSLNLMLKHTAASCQFIHLLLHNHTEVSSYTKLFSSSSPLPKNVCKAPTLRTSLTRRNTCHIFHATAYRSSWSQLLLQIFIQSIYSLLFACLQKSFST